MPTLVGTLNETAYKEYSGRKKRGWILICALKCIVNKILKFYAYF